MKKQWKKGGEAAVDSGQLALIDPMYIETCWARRGESHGPRTGDMHYEAACERSEGGQGYGGLSNGVAQYDLAFVTSTAFGDGVYPVYVQTDDDGCVVAMQVRFDGGKP